MEILKKIEGDLNLAIQAVLSKYNTEDLPGCEFHGQLVGIFQHQGHPETATGWRFKIGDGLPLKWPSSPSLEGLKKNECDSVS